MSINLSRFNKVLRGNSPDVGSAVHSIKTLDRANPIPSFAKILKGQSTGAIDNTERAFSGNTAIGTRLRGLKLW